MKTGYSTKLTCFHCGEICLTEPLHAEEKFFCCEGCKMVYNLLNDSGLCQYYNLNAQPGNSQRQQARDHKFAFLDDEKIAQRLISFTDDEQVHAIFYLPQIHCSSCLWLLENLHKLNDAVLSSKVNFPKKEVTVIFNSQQLKLRGVAELLTRIGYEPYFSLNDIQDSKPKFSRQLIYQVGVAGFCFGNIMLLSFADYFGLNATEGYLHGWFRILSLLLSLPVLFYAARPFFSSAYKSLVHKHLNIDAPIALAILVTFIRSAYEVVSDSGSGYFDSMAGIVFFMLIGRLLQDKTYRHLSFDRDYTCYFPIAVSVLKDQKELSTALPDIKAGDTLIIHNEELIPVDGILTRGRACIDYSFVTGESAPVTKETGELIYAGGKQTGMQIELLVIKEVSQSYLTSLWNREEKKPVNETPDASFVQQLSRYFTYVVMLVAFGTGIYWNVADPSKTWNAITAILIIACPCALLLANTFTNGNVLRILSRNHFFLRNATVIESIASADHIVFDKTGTLTTIKEPEITYAGKPLDKEIQEAVAALAAHSRHPLCRAIHAHLPNAAGKKVQGVVETTGKGIEGLVNDTLISLGSAAFIYPELKEKENGTKVFVALEKMPVGSFQFRNRYREALVPVLNKLQRWFSISLLSGDNSAERNRLQNLLGNKADILFNQQPPDKSKYIKSLQLEGRQVMMVGDGLNDAGALQQSDVGIAVAEDINNFTPASDAILEAKSFHLLPAFITLCKKNKAVVKASFAFSILYNLIGIYFAVQGVLSPMIAAILMPASSISILLLTFGSTNLIARRLKL